MPKKVLVALPPAMLEHIDSVAQCEHRTRSDLIREALRRYLENFRRNQAPTMSISTIGTQKVALLTEDEPGKPLSKPFGEQAAFVRTSIIAPIPTESNVAPQGQFILRENNDNSLSIERDREYNLPPAR